MTKAQEVLAALLDAAGKDVSVSQLKEIVHVPAPRCYIRSLIKAGFTIHTRPGSKKGGSGGYRLEAEGRERIRAMDFIIRPHRRPRRLDAVNEKFINRTRRTVKTPTSTRIHAVSEDFINSMDPRGRGQALRAEIDRRRKENKEKGHKRGWNPEEVLKYEQALLLDWIEKQLKAMFPNSSEGKVSQ